MTQHYYREEHEAFREQVRRFIAKEILPFHAQWEKDGIVPRSLWQRAGELGLLCMTSPSAYGGQDADVLFPFVLNEELAKTYVTGPSFGLHSDIIAPYLVHFGSEAQKQAWLPKMATGEVITAIAMTEPGAGSDLQAIKTRADRDGDDYLITGQKTFISNGQLADLVVVVAKTDPSQGAKGVSLFLVEADREGFRRGRNLEKIGRKAQDTSELFFDQVRIPESSRLAPEGQGFFCLMKELPRERMLIAVSAMATTEAVLEDTIAYVKARHIFGKPIIDFQHNRFTLAGLKTEVKVARAFINQCMLELLEDRLEGATAAMAKLHVTELQNRVIDACLQLHGGYGYMWEYPVARAWADSRISRIYGGSSEVMKELIGRTL
jgi:alkylation response protein AidB-like acyl-CoA dehydrogenase